MNPPNGEFRCYLCGWDKFIWFPIGTVRITVVNGKPVILATPDSIETDIIRCDRCGIIQYIHFNGWYIGNSSLRWDDHLKKLVDAPSTNSIEKGLGKLNSAQILELAAKLGIKEE